MVATFNQREAAKSRVVVNYLKTFTTMLAM
jgi:hypothetical protein